MVRTQIYIPESTHKKLMRMARRSSKPMAQLVREFISKGLETSENSARPEIQILGELVQLKVKGGPKDLSARLDHYLYRSDSEQ